MNYFFLNRPLERLACLSYPLPVLSRRCLIAIFFIVCLCILGPLTSEARPPKVKGAAYLPTCCIVGPDFPMVSGCEAIERDKVQGLSFQYYAKFDVDTYGGTSVSIESIDIQVIGPKRTVLATTDMMFYKNILNQVDPLAFPYTMDANTEANIIADFKLSFGLFQEITIGTYSIIISVNGKDWGEGGSPFSTSAILLHYISEDDVDCPSEESPISQFPFHPRRLGQIPLSSSMANWYPNPAKEYGIISFSVPTEEKVEIRILNLQGQLMLQPIVPSYFPPGTYRLKIDLTAVPPGVLITQIHSKSNRHMLKWIKLE